MLSFLRGSLWRTRENKCESILLVSTVRAEHIDMSAAVIHQRASLRRPGSDSWALSEGQCVTWLVDCVLPSFGFSCSKLFFMSIKSWQVNEQVPALIRVSDFPDELTAGWKARCIISGFNSWGIIIIRRRRITHRCAQGCRSVGLGPAWSHCDSDTDSFPLCSHTRGHSCCRLVAHTHRCLEERNLGGFRKENG